MLDLLSALKHELEKNAVGASLLEGDKITMIRAEEEEQNKKGMVVCPLVHICHVYLYICIYSFCRHIYIYTHRYI